MTTAALGAFTEGARSQALSITLTPADHNGYHIACSGGADGAIDLSVSGGTPPYAYVWSTGATTQDVSGLSSGFISVRVTDAASGNERAELTLTEPAKLEGVIVPYQYPGGHNISCHSCYNGSIQLTMSGGLPAYAYAWADGPTTEDRTQLGAGNYQVDVTDANGCVYRSAALTLTQPERDDWTQHGNAGTTPGTHFLGTTDNKDVVFKSNGAERLRIESDGDLKVSTLAATGDRLVYVDQNGVLKRHNWGLDGQMSIIPWYLGGNNDVASTLNRIGPTNAVDFIVITDNTEHMRVTVDGKVGIGTVPPAGSIDQYRLYVQDGIVTRDVLVKHGDWPDFVFATHYPLRPLTELRDYLKAHAHLPTLPSASDLDKNGGVALGEITRGLTHTVEEQTLYILQLEEKLERMEQRLKALETTKH